MTAPVNRPWRLVVVPALSASATGLGLVEAMAPAPLAVGVAVGGLAGLAAGWACSWATAGTIVGRRALAAVAGLLVAVVALAAAPAVATLDASAPVRLRRIVGLFLTVALPARGLADLAAVVTLVVAPVVALAVWAALRGRALVVVAATVAGLVGTSLLAGARQPPWWVALMVVVLVGLVLLIESRTYHSDLPPLLGAATAVRRQLPWWRPALAGVVAIAIAGLLAGTVDREPFDVRQFVAPDVVVIADQSPLALVVRLQVDAPPAADGVDVTVDVAGPSPGRLRLAVLDQYRDEGWRQSAAFAVTGEVLAPPGVLVADDGFDARVRVSDGPADSGLRAVPTAGAPLVIDDPSSARYAPDAGVLWVPGDQVRYLTEPSPIALPNGPAGAPVGLDGALYECRAGSVVESSAHTLAAGTATPAERLGRIESWLKLTKIYDPEGPGGQTIGSVEQFIGRPYARGNLEVFVTAYALLARCAGVPVRVVVGYPAPPADEVTEYRATSMTAWVETPVDGLGWVALDPIPTPAEQQRQAELADTPAPAPAPPPAPVLAREPLDVRAIGPDDRFGRRELGLVAVALLGTLATLAVVAWWIRGAAVRRRRRVADPAVATRLAWRSVLEAVRDSGVEIGPHLTAREAARASVGRVPAPASRGMAELAAIADRATFDAVYTTDGDARRAWGLADAVLALVPVGWRTRFGALRHPSRAWRRWRSVACHPRRRARWPGEPPSGVLDDDGVRPADANAMVRVGPPAT